MTPGAASSTAITSIGAPGGSREVRPRCSSSPACCPRVRRRVDGDLAQARPAAREGAGGRRPAAGAHAHPRRQRRIRPSQPLVRADDAARPARDGRRATRSGSASGGSRASCTRSVSAIVASRGSSAAARTCPARSSSSTSTTTGASATSPPTTSTTTCARSRGGDFTAKDFRTWAGTVLAFRALRALTPVEHEPAARRNLLEAIRIAADGLGNTPAVARGSYVHPAVTEAYLDGELPGSSRRAVAATGATVGAAPTSGLPDRSEELALIRLLRERVAAGSKRSGSRKRG